MVTKNILGSQLVYIASKDINKVFNNLIDVKLEFKEKPGSLDNIVYRGSCENHRIVISKELSIFKHTTLDKAYLTLMITSHELAHYINKHNYHNDKDCTEHRSLELWADYFGARIFMILMSDSDLYTRKTLQRKFAGFSQSDKLENIGKSLITLFDMFMYRNFKTF